MRPNALFISPSSEVGVWKRWPLPRLPPLGLLSIASSLRKKGCPVELLDCSELTCTFGRGAAAPLVARAIDRSLPFLTGLSIYSAVFEEARELARLVKERHPGGLLVAGGAHPSAEPELTLEQIPWLDAVCVGSGEEVCGEIMDGTALDRIPGLMVRGKEEHFTRRKPIADLDTLPFPDFGLVNHSYYSDYAIWPNWLSRGWFVLTSRGCPHSCRFCASEWTRPVRYHSVEYVVELARSLSGFDLDTFVFCDATLMSNPDRLSALCEAFIRSGLFRPQGRLRWNAPARADEVRPDLLRLMKRAGCTRVAMGIESDSDKTLQRLQKRTTVEVNRQAIAQVKEAGLDLFISFMIGSPGETEEDIRGTFEFVRSVKCNAKVCFAFRPLPGSGFYKEFTENGILDKRSIDWSTLGLHRSPSRTFCSVDHGRLIELYREGMHLAGDPGRVFVHHDVATRCQSLVREIRQVHDLVIVNSDRDLTRVKISDRLANAWAKTSVRRYASALSFARHNPRLLLRIPGKIRQLLRTHVLKQS